MNKFFAFLARNQDAPFHVKRAVWESALMNSLLYASETWIGAKCSKLESCFLRSAKALLGVRHQTCNDLVKVELDITSARAKLRATQKKFITSVSNHVDTPIKKALRIARESRSPMAAEITRLNSQTDILGRERAQTRQWIRTSSSSRMTQYLSTNPRLTPPCFYNCDLPEHKRIALTRIRLSSHHLKIETGRWSRIPRDQRLCSCGEVQTEEHVLCFCDRSSHLRQVYPQLTFTSLAEVLDSDDIPSLGSFVLNVLKIYA